MKSEFWDTFCQWLSDTYQESTKLKFEMLQSPHEENKAEIISARLSEIRDLVKHENDLINHRLTWMVMFETFLFAGYALVMTTLLDNENSKVTSSYNTVCLLGSVIPIIGLVVTLAIGNALYHSNAAIFFLSKKYRTFISELKNLPNGNDPNANGIHYPIVFGFIDDVDEDIRKSNSWKNNFFKIDKFCDLFLPWFVLPVTFILAWGYLFFL